MEVNHFPLSIGNYTRLFDMPGKITILFILGYKTAYRFKLRKKQVLGG